jgi:hypothetical protein
MCDVNDIDNSFDKNELEIINVDSDGSCLYKCLIAYFNYYQDIYKDNKDVTELFNNNMMDEYYEENENTIVFNLQKKLKNWLVEHQDDKCTIIDDMSVRDFILMMHSDIGTIEEYDKIFEIFAGDPNFINIKTNDVYKSGKNKGQPKTAKSPIPLRWGSTAELYAFNKIYGINIIQYMPIRFDNKAKKFIPCTLKSKQYRFKPIQVIGNDDKNDKSNTIRLLSFESNRHHYQLLV